MSEMNEPTSSASGVDGEVQPFKRAFVLVLDGLSSELTGSGVRGQWLPNLAVMARRGCYSPLRSVVPSTTAPAMAAVLTGTQAGKNGIFGFVSMDGEGERRIVSYRDIRVPTVVDLFNRFQKGLGLFSIPLLYPVPEVKKGFAVSGFATPPNRKFAEPDAAFKKLKSLGYFPNPRGSPSSLDEDGLALETIKSMKHRSNCLTALLDEYLDDLSLIVAWLSETDHASHHLWHRPRLMSEVYEAADEIVGGLLSNYVDEDTIFMVISDHGFTSIEGVFLPNSYLQSKGYLRLKVRPVTLFRLLASLGIRALRRRSSFLDVRIRRAVGVTKERSLFKRFATRMVLSFSDVDTSSSVAFAYGSPNEFGFIRLTPRLRQGRARDKAVNMLIDDLRSLDGIVDEARLAQEVFNGPLLDEGPDIVIKLREKVISSSNSIPADPRKTFLPPGGSLVGDHSEYGVFFALGRGIKSEAALEGASLLDVLPTALYSLGLPIPDFLDGKQLTELFKGTIQTKLERFRVHRAREGLKRRISNLRERIKREGG